MISIEYYKGQAVRDKSTGKIEEILEISGGNVSGEDGTDGALKIVITNGHNGKREVTEEDITTDI